MCLLVFQSDGTAEKLAYWQFLELDFFLGSSVNCAWFFCFCLFKFLVILPTG